MNIPVVEPAGLAGLLQEEGHRFGAHDGEERLVIAEETKERWTESLFPASRVVWDELRVASTAAGMTGVVVPNDPRLIDLLRNPDIIETRDDLKLSFG